MSESNYHYFNLLKNEIAIMMQRSYPGINLSVSEWKKQEITDFQEDLRIRVNGQISEKWFYTHMKSDKSTLPRIDLLNLLSKYAGYTNWDDFIFQHKGERPVVSIPKSPNRVFIIVPVILIVVSGILFGIFKLFHTREYKFCFYDADTKESITSTIIEVTLLRENESPVNYLCTRDGCFSLKTDKSQVRFVVQTPYYEPDTITRLLDKFNRNEKIKLRANNYALMINYFSTMNVKDWQKRRMQLDKMIDDAAVIYQVFGNETIGMDLYTKWEFINMITMPSARLKLIEVLDTKMKGERISLLRFRIKKNK